MRVLSDRWLGLAALALGVLVWSLASGGSAAPMRATATPIAAIQGAGHLSPLVGQTVTTAGVVTARRANGFYLQDPVGDGRPETSDAVFVFTASPPAVGAGARLTVTASVAEFRGDPTALTLTELVSPSIAVAGSGVVTPVRLTTDPAKAGLPNTRVIPVTVIEDDAAGDVETGGVFDPERDGIDFWESLEGMLVEIEDAVAVGPRSVFGEVPVLAGGGAGAGLRTPRGGIVVRPGDFNPERIVLDDDVLKAGGASMPQVAVGDRLPGALRGVVDYAFGGFRVHLTTPPGVPDTSGRVAQSSVPPVTGADRLSVATYNVRELSRLGADASRLLTVASHIRLNLGAPDIVALQEIADDSGGSDNGVVGAAANLAALTDAIAAGGGPAYDFRQIDPVNDADGGPPGSNIRPVFLFRADRGLAFVDRPGPPATGTAAARGADGVQLTLSPGLLDPGNPAFLAGRKPLAAEFLFNGRRLFLVNCHLKSKSEDDPLFGRYQPPRERTALTRTAQTEIVARFARDLLTLDPDADLIVLGDLNDHHFAPALAALGAAGLHNLTEMLPEAERYTYLLDGNAQALEHVFVSAALFALPREHAIVHLNAEFPPSFPGGASDHDPQVVRLTVPSFLDVAPAHWAYGSIQQLFERGITAGCSTGPVPGARLYCPASPVTRDQMAVFLGRSTRGAGFAPPPAAGRFADVPADHWAAPWIEQALLDGLTTGLPCGVPPAGPCDGARRPYFRPGDAVSREQMAVFLVRARRGAAFVPPAATGRFADVRSDGFFAPYVEQALLDGITTGVPCGGAAGPCDGQSRPYFLPKQPVTRDQMAVFLLRTFP